MRRHLLCALVGTAAVIMLLAVAALAAPRGGVRLSAASLPWDAEARTLYTALDAIERAARRPYAPSSSACCPS